MIRKLFVLLISVLVGLPAFADTVVDTAWVRRYDAAGYDLAFAMSVDDSGNVYVTGTSGTLKYDGDGNQLWTDSLPGVDIAVDSSGNVYVAGYNEFFVAKYHPNGDTAWVRGYSGPAMSSASAIAVDGEGYVYVTGTSGNSYVTIKYYPDGDTAWLREYGSFQSCANALAISVSGDVYVTGVSNYVYATVKYHSDGDTGWVRSYQGPAYYWDEASAIAIDYLGNIIVTGTSRGTSTADDYATIKYYPNGDTAWTRRYDGEGNGNDRAYAITVDGLGNVYVAGGSDGMGTDLDYLTIKYDENGNELWASRHNGSGNWEDIASAVALDDSGNVFVTGKLSSETAWDYGTIKLDSDGDTLWVRTYNGPGNDQDAACDIAVDHSNNVYVAGWSTGSGTAADYATIKYRQSGPGPSPNVVSTLPAQNQLNAAVDANLSVVFDIEMDPATLNDSTFVVNAWSTGLHRGATTYDSQSKTATLNPDVDFDEGEIVTVVLTKGIKSSDGTPMESSYVWSFTTRVDQGTACFAPPSYYSTGDASVSVFCADLDGDADLDLALADWFSNSVSVLKNNGDGTFQVAVNYGTGSYPAEVLCADMDGDNDLDLAVANNSSNTVSILKNNGDGTFQNRVDYAAGEGPSSVFCADLDGDNDLDLAVANCGSGSVSILKNNGEGAFQAPVSYEAGTCPVSVFCADLDGDNDLDLAVANNWSNDVSILRNTGDGTFETEADYAVGEYPRSVFCADLDGDGDLDLAVANQYSNISILRNTGDGTFQDTVNYEAGSGPWAVFCADLDGYNGLDLAVANVGGSVSILRNAGDGTFQGAVNFGAGDGPFSVFCADVDGDGDLDLTAGDYYGDNVSILLNIRRGDCTDDGTTDVGDVVFLLNYLFKSGPIPAPLPVGDVNCDGIDDLGDVVYLLNYIFKGGPAPCC